MLRVSAGFCKGLKLKVIDGPTRPTGAKTRSAILNSLQHALPEARVLDLFAGSGVMGIEAVSRGAVHCTFVENHPQVLTALRSNMDQCLQRTQKQGLAIEMVIAKKNALAPFTSEKAFNLVFCDPPYADTKKMLPTIAGNLNSLTSPDAVWVLEFQRKSVMQEDFLHLESLGWYVEKLKTFGDTAVAMLCKKSIK